MPIKRKTKEIKKEKPKIERTSLKITRQQKEAATIRENNSLPYKKGDFCFYLEKDNKPRFAEIQSAHEYEEGYYYVVIEQHDYKFVTVEHKWCADNEKELKRMKRC